MRPGGVVRLGNPLRASDGDFDGADVSRLAAGRQHLQHPRPIAVVGELRHLAADGGDQHRQPVLGVPLLRV